MSNSENNKSQGVPQETIRKITSLCQEKKFAEAIKMSKDLTSQYPSEPVLFNVMGVAYAETGDYKNAIDSYAKALLIKPASAQIHCNMGVALKSQGNLEAAIEHYKHALNLDHSNYAANLNLGNVLKEQGKPKEALRYYESVLATNPQSAQLHYNIGTTYHQLGVLNSAIEHYRRVIAINPRSVEVYNNLGVALRDTNKIDGAIDSFRKALDLNPEFLDALNNLGVTLRDAGRVEEAADCFRRAVKYGPQFAEAHRYLAGTKKFESVDNDVEAMVSAYNSTITNKSQRMHLSYALGKVYEDIGEYDKAFKFISEGSNIKRSSIDFEFSQIKDQFEKLRSAFSKQYISSWSIHGCPSDSPIFIVGMPRSGTTLVEQILASHSYVFGGGELSYLPQLVRKFLGQLSMDSDPIETLSLSAEEVRQAGDLYTNTTQSISGNSKRVTDKLPLNFRYIGFIATILPNAKIIHCDRDPKDTCLSIFKTLFQGNEHNYSYNLEELASYYNQYVLLMEYWDTVIPEKIFHITYEDLVTNQERYTEELLNYCNLPWEDSCMEFYKTSRTVRTASASQVRNPIHSKSVGLWKQYDVQLSSLVSALEHP